MKRENSTEDLLAIVQKKLLGPKGEPEPTTSALRVEVLSEIQCHCKAMEEHCWKTETQRNFLMGCCVVILGFLAWSLWRWQRIQPIAAAKAYRIQVERQQLAARLAVEANKHAMLWLMDRVNKIKADPETSQVEKDLWLSNLFRIGDQIKATLESAQQAERRLASAEIPDRIDNFTFIRDPYTGQTLPLNATGDGRLDLRAVQKWMDQDQMLLRLLAAAKAASEPGAKPLPPFVFDGLQEAIASQRSLARSRS